jgi:hypothetical protein
VSLSIAAKEILTIHILIDVKTADLIKKTEVFYFDRSSAVFLMFVWPIWKFAQKSKKKFFLLHFCLISPE